MDFPLDNQDDGWYYTKRARTIEEWRHMARTVWATNYDFSKPAVLKKKVKRISGHQILFGYKSPGIPDRERPLIDTCDVKQRIRRKRPPRTINIKPHVWHPQKIQTQRCQENDWQVFVKTPLSTTLCLQLHHSISVQDLKAIIDDKLGIAIEKQVLFIGPLKMCNLLSLGDHGVKDQSNIVLEILPGLLGGADKPVEQGANPGAAAKESTDVSQYSMVSSGPETEGASGGASVLQKSIVQSRPQSETPINITGDRNILVVGDHNAVNFAGNPTEIYEMRIRIKTLEAKNEALEKDHSILKAKTEALEKNLSTLLQHVNAKKSWFAKLFYKYGIGRLDRISPGSVLFFVRFSKRQELEKLWKMFKDGSLQAEFTNILLTAEPIEIGYSVSLTVSIEQEDYLRGLQAFEQQGPETEGASGGASVLQEEIVQSRPQSETPINITGDRNILVVGDHNAVNFAGNPNEIYELIIRIKTLEAKNEALEKDHSILKAKTEALEKNLSTLLQHVNAKKSWFAKLFYKHGIGRLDRISPGSVLFFLRFSKRQELEKLWKMFEDGSLQAEFTNILLTAEPIEIGYSVSLTVSIEQEDYLRGLQAFEQQDGQQTDKSMETWSTDKLKEVLLQEGISPEIVNQLYEEEVDGSIFAKYSENHLKTDFTLKKGPLRKLLYFRDKYLQLSQMSSSEETVSNITQERAVVTKQNPDDILSKEGETQAHTSALQTESSCPTGARPKEDKRLKQDAVSESTREFCESKTENRHIIEVEKRLRRLLLGDEKYTLDESYYPVLVANKPSSNMLSSDENTAESLSFLKNIDWKVVFDFYGHSNSDGLCQYFSESRKPNLQLPETVEPTNINYIEGGEDTVWIFCNGREDDSNICQPVLSRPKWNEERSKDVEEVIGFISKQSMLPSSRSVIVFLILSESDIGILSDAFHQFFSAFHGMDNITCIVDNDKLNKLWEDEVEKWCSVSDLRARSIVNVPLPDINRIIGRMSRVNMISDMQLPTEGKKGVYLSERHAKSWKDISVVCKNECQNTDMNEDHPEFEEFVKEKEIEFYKGHKPQWWNFELTDGQYNNGKGYNHVLRRSEYDKIQSKITSALQGSLSTNLIITITIFHQPGCGGSTLGRHQLWEFHKSYRCIVVDKVTAKTAQQILYVRKYRCPNEDSCSPVLLLADDLEDPEVTDLIADMECLSKNMIVRGVLCVLLHCKRTPDPQALLQRSDKRLAITLQQSLDHQERKWFQQKYDELETKQDTFQSEDYKPERLIAFMMMKEECNPKYVKKVVSEVLSDVWKKSEKEHKILKYAAVLNLYLDHAAIPVSTCDEFMGYSRSLTARRGKATNKLKPWEKTLSVSSRMLLTQVQIATIGHVHGVKVVHRCVAEEIVNQITEEKDQTLADIILEFLHSNLVRSVSHSKNYLISEIHDLLIRRKTSYNETTLFSPLIEQVYIQEKPKALEILEAGPDVFGPHYAQQAARLCYLREKDYTRAHAYALKAIEQLPNNLYMKDTEGQIFRREINEKYCSKYGDNEKVLPMEDSKDLIELAIKAIEIFKKVQQDPSPVFAGAFLSEVDIAFKVIEVFDHCIPIFRAPGGRNKLKEYLLTERIPDGLEEWEPYHTFLKGLKPNIDRAMGQMENFLTFSKDASQNSLDLKKRQQEKLHKLFVVYFGVPLDATQPENAADLPDWRRRQASALGADNFNRIFELGKNKDNVENIDKLQTVLTLLIQNKPYTNFDLRNMICAILALSSLGRSSLPSVDEVYDMVMELKKKNENHPSELYGPFFLLMFLWPHPKDDTHRIKHPQTIKGCISDLRNKWESQWNHVRHAEDDRHYSNYKSKSVRHRTGRRKPLTFFFVAEGEGLQRFAHINEFHASNTTILTERDNFWERKVIKTRLTRFSGTLYHNTSLSYRTPTGEQLYIKLALPKTEVESQEPVTFYLGFSWEGPVAYYVKSKEAQAHHCRPKSYGTAYPRYLETPRQREDLETEIFKLEKQKNELLQQVDNLATLEKRKNAGQKLTEKQVNKVKRKTAVLEEISTLEEKIESLVRTRNLELDEDFE